MSYKHITPLICIIFILLPSSAILLIPDWAVSQPYLGMATLIPDAAELHTLPTPLNSGEAHLVAYLARELGPEWEVYVQPFLNGTRPDVIALHPTRGALVLEVKDWSLGCYSWGQGQRRWNVRGSHGEASIPNPFDKAEHYRQNILRFLVPEVGALVREQGWRALGMVRVGVYFHGATEAQVRRLTAGRIHGAVHQLAQDSLVPGAAERWVGGEGRVPTEFAPLLRAWLNPPLHSVEQRAPLTLTKEQAALAKPRAGATCFQGVAGSGKSLVLAARAARIAGAGGKVLMVSFNITLWHLLRDGVRRAGGGAAAKNVVFNHFHGLARNLAVEAGLTWAECGNDPAVMVRRAAAKLHLKYDAVLVDEAQDLEDDWAEALQSLVREGGQFVAACDKLQNIYARGGAWLAQPGLGQMRELRASVRLHDHVVRLANDFAQAYLPGVGLLAESNQPMLPLGAPEFRWREMAGREVALTAAVARVRELHKRGAHPTDIAVLLPDHALGLEFVARMKALGWEVNHVFTSDQQDKRQKYAFWMGDSRLKACTVHSFKGWEARHIVAVLDTPAGEADESATSQAMVAYTAITRAQDSLTILNLAAQFRGFKSRADQEKRVA